MINKIKSPESIEFIKQYIKYKPTDLALLAPKYPNLPIKEICNQIECRQKAKNKIPSWYSNFQLIFPPKISWEQCSSEHTANYKASIIKGETLLDLTGGFGIDSYFLSKTFDQVIHIEQNKELQKIAKHNFNVLETRNIKSIQTDSIEYLKSTTAFFDNIYIDPARRDGNNKKVNSLSDCTPNVLDHLNLLLAKSTALVIKTSPLLDIKHTINELEYVQQVHVVSVKNECKEVIYILNKTKSNNPKIVCININSKQDNYEFYFKNENETKANFSLPQKYLYEPNSSLLKAGAFKSIARFYSLNKLQKNTHLYTSDYLIPFSGKRFKVLTTCGYNKKEIRTYLAQKKANIATRNFREKPEEIAKKLGIKLGGKIMLFACTLLNNKWAIIITEPID